MTEPMEQSNQSELTRLLEDLKSDDETVRKYAAEDLGYEGYCEAIPYLIDNLTDSSIAVADACSGALVRIGTKEVADKVSENLFSEDVRLRNYAVEVLSQMGETSVDTLETLIRSEDRDVRKFTVDILLEIGSEKSIHALVAALDDPDVNISATAADGIGKIGSAEHVPVLQKYMDSEVWMKCAVIRGMGTIGGPIAMKAILPCIQDDDMMVKISAIQALGQIAELKSLPDLFHLLLWDSLPLFGGEAINAIYAIFQKYPDEDYEEIISEQLLEPIVELTQQGGLDHRLKAIEILGFIRSKSAVDHLIRLFADADAEIRRAAEQSVMKIDPSDLTSLEALLQGDSGSSMEQRSSAIRCIGATSNPKRVALLTPFLNPNEEELTLVTLEAIDENFQPVPCEAIIELLNSEFDTVRVAVAEAMGRLGNECFIDPLIKTLQDETEEVYDAADNALIEIGTTHENVRVQPYLESFSPAERKMAFQYYGMHNPEEHASTFVEGLRDPNIDIRIIAFKVLANLRLLTFEHVTDGLGDSEETVCIQAARSLFSFVGREELLPFVQEAIAKAGHERVKIELLQLLASLDEPGVLEVIIPLLQDESSWVKVEAVEALKQIGDSSIVGELKKLLTTDNEELLEAVENAIDELEY